ncbi:hypothetical protein B0I33_10316 [Prauserella shujinwangii]|uniref:Pentapeptide repeat protein n=2 Tax=Prauserella shujinwangii TaxID=1453103 RepID=A0A2T0LXZ0_9PSEU|nr:hypothetical protein B0I33_10316 [Prauserella shujinwangii]
MGDLTDTERAVVGALGTGTWLDLGEHRDPVVRAELIRQLAAGWFAWPGDELPDPRGIRLRGARIPDVLDLSEMESSLPLRLVDCQVSGPVLLIGSRLCTVDMSGLEAGGVAAQELRLERSLLLRRARLRATSSYAALHLGGSDLGGRLDLGGAELISPEGSALGASNLRAGGGVFLTEGFRAEGRGELGTVRLPGAELGGQLNMSGARVTNPKLREPAVLPARRRPRRHRARTRRPPGPHRAAEGPAAARGAPG